MNELRCPVCGRLFSKNGYPFHRHMKYHERKGEAKSFVKTMDGPLSWRAINRFEDDVDDLPLFQNPEPPEAGE